MSLGIAWWQLTRVLWAWGEKIGNLGTPGEHCLRQAKWALANKYNNVVTGIFRPFLTRTFQWACVYHKEYGTSMMDDYHACRQLEVASAAVFSPHRALTTWCAECGWSAHWHYIPEELGVSDMPWDGERQANRRFGAQITDDLVLKMNPRSPLLLTWAEGITFNFSCSRVKGPSCIIPSGRSPKFLMNLFPE